jgi:hypothetical protein
MDFWKGLTKENNWISCLRSELLNLFIREHINRNEKVMINKTTENCFMKHINRNEKVMINKTTENCFMSNYLNSIW